MATAWPKRLVVLLVLFATMATMSPAVSAQTGPTEAPRLTPEVFEPGPINRTPSGGPPLTGTLDAPLEEPDHKGRELVERRTEDSRTFVGQDGKFETVFYGGPIHYRDARGQWQPIDNTLVPAPGSGAGLRNAAGEVQVSLPPMLGTGPVQVSRDDVSVAFSLQGAKAVPPSLGVPKTSPVPASEAMNKATATYPSANPGVDVSYTATARGVKEDLVLAGPASPSSFDFTVALSPGLSAVETDAGGISFLDAAGTERASFAAPFAYDAAYHATGAEGAFTEDAVSLHIVQTSPQLVVRLAADPAWLAAPERAWPVVIDPVVHITGANADTYIRKAYPDNNYGGSSYLYLWSGDLVRRPLHFKNIASFFDEPVTLYSATLRLYATTTVSTPINPVGAYRIDTPGWNSNQATWNDRLSGVRWNTPGGDFRSQPLFVNNDVTGAAGWRSFPITSAAQAWLDGEANHGVLLKYVNEGSGDVVSFASSNHPDASVHPVMVVNWEPLEGIRSPYAAEEFDLGAAGQAAVNVASGNLALSTSDLSIAGTGLPATIERFYRSRGEYIASAGARWRMWPQSEERLYDTSVKLPLARNGDMAWQGGPDGLLVFSKNPDGSFTSPHGYRATLARGADGLFTLTDHASGTIKRFEPSGYLREITDRNGNRLTFGYAYDSATGEHFMTSMTDTQGRVTTFERGGEWKVTKVIDPAGRTHVYGYDRTDAQANLATYTNPAGGITRYEYTGAQLGLLSRVTDPNGNVTTFGYDSRDRVTSLTRVTDPSTGAGSTWRFDYSIPWQTKVTDANGNGTTHHFDRRGRVTKVVDALGHAREASYDSNSNVLNRTSALGNKTTATFDANNNLKTSTLPTGATSTLDYDDARFKHFPTKLTSPQGNALTSTYDAKGNIEKIADSMPTQGNTTFTYNLNGTVKTATDPRGKVTTYEYYPSGELKTIIPPAPLGRTSFTYDGLSRVDTIADGKGQVTDYDYDILDRPTSVRFTGGLNVTNGYDDGGRLITRSDATGTTSYVYDALDRLKQENLPGGVTTGYTYDALGNLTSMTDLAGTVSYRYNAVNLVDELTEPGGAVTTFGYDNDDNRTSTTYPNGVVQTTLYDTSARLKTIEGKRGSTVLSRFSYDYTLNGKDTGLRHTVKDKSNNTTTYSYDALERLTRARTVSSLGLVNSDYQYTYDAAGNRTSETVPGLLGTVTTTSTFNDADQLTARGNVTYSYDDNGNQTGSSAGQALVYNGADQTTSLKKAGGSALSATYAGANQVERTSAGATSFTNSLLGVTSATEGTVTTATTRDPAGNLVGLRTGAGRSYYLVDGLGSVVAVTDASGNVTNSYTYDPYGITTETTSSGAVANPWRYTGQYQDSATGLYKMGARYYQPELGRWTQQDPSGQEANAYLYTGGNPVNFVDPSGYCFAGVFGENCNIRAVVGQLAAAAASTAVVAAACAATAATAGLGCAAAALGSAAAQAIVSYAACTPTEEESVAGFLEYYRESPERYYQPGC